MNTISVEKLRTWLEEGRPVRLNEAGIVPESDVAELEAGANRCAIS